MLARSYVALLVCISVFAVGSAVLGFKAQIVTVNQESVATDRVSQGLSRGDIVLWDQSEDGDRLHQVADADRSVLPLAGFPALWLTYDQQWFTAWVIVTLIASMVSIPGPIRTTLRRGRQPSEPETDEEPKRGGRLLVAVSAVPVILVLAATLPLI